MEFEEFIMRLILAFKLAQKSIEEKTAAKSILKIFIYLPCSESYLNLKKTFSTKNKNRILGYKKNSQRKFHCEFLLIIKNMGRVGLEPTTKRL